MMVYSKAPSEQQPGQGPELQLVTTSDGSHTVFVPAFNEHYHSTFGATTESMHVFIHAGLLILAPQRIITVFEVGFGTGLNALLSCTEAHRRNLEVIYHTIEKYPIDHQLIGKLNYPEIIQDSGLPAHIFRTLHQVPWEIHNAVHPGFTLHKIKADFTTYNLDFNYDIVFFDAFSPAMQPEMWKKEHFEKIFNMLNTKGILVTYCVKGQVKRNLRESGFHLETLPGPPGKREILRATKE